MKYIKKELSIIEKNHLLETEFLLLTQFIFYFKYIIKYLNKKYHKKYLLISKLAQKNRKLYILVNSYTLDKQHLLISNEANLK